MLVKTVVILSIGAAFPPGAEIGTHHETNMNNTSSPLKAFKRATSPGVIRSPRLSTLILFTPGGLEDAFRSMSSPAQKLELPSGVLTYSTADLKPAAQRFSKYGAYLLAPDEVADQLPLYPKSLPANPGK